jgi:hypothetical protein
MVTVLRTTTSITEARGSELAEKEVPCFWIHNILLLILSRI